MIEYDQIRIANQVVQPSTDDLRQVPEEQPFVKYSPQIVCETPDTYFQTFIPFIYLIL